MFFFAGFAWALWITWNKMAIEKTFVKLPTDVIYVAISFLQRWSILLKEKDKERVWQVLEATLVHWHTIQAVGNIFLQAFSGSACAGGQ